MDYNTKRVDELRKIAKSRGLKRYSKLKKAELVALLSGSKSEVKSEVKPKRVRRVAECKKPKKAKQPTIKEIRERCKSLGLVYDAKLKDCRESKRKGKANKELVGYLSQLLGVGKSQIEIARGHTSRNKLIAIGGLSQEEILKRLLPR